MKQYFDMEINLPRSLLPKATTEVFSLLHGIYSGLGEYRPNVGISFPLWQPGLLEHQATVGNVIRIIGELHELRKIFYHSGVNALVEDGLVDVSSIIPVPEDIDHVCFKRNRTISRRYKRFHDGEIEHSEVLHKGTLLPFIELKSRSNGHNYRYYIDKVQCPDEMNGEFNNYGLGVNGTTVPFF